MVKKISISSSNIAPQKKILDHLLTNSWPPALKLDTAKMDL